MAVRTTMATLISRTRDLVNDNPPLAANQVFSDQQVQDALDRRRAVLWYDLLRPEPTLGPTGYSWQDYFSRWSDIEDDVVLYDGSWYAVTLGAGDVADTLTGHWYFAASHVPPIFLVGKTYDPYRSAADLADQWASKVALSYNVAAGQSANLMRSQMFAQLQALAKSLRARSRTMSMPAERSDTLGEGAGTRTW